MSETYTDWQLANIKAGLSRTMVECLERPWPPHRTVLALRKRGLMKKPGWTLTDRGRQLLAFIKRRTGAR